MLAADGAENPTLFVQLPDGDPADLVAVFRYALRDAAIEHPADGSDEIRDLPGVAAAIGAFCASGVTVILDEFQYCYRGPLASLPSLLQAQVDRLQNRDSVGGLMVLGSVQTEMEALLEDRKAPLFGRTTFRITLGPWDLRTVFEVCEQHKAADPARCLTLWTLFGGVPKYWRHFAEVEGLGDIADSNSWAMELCRRLFLQKDAPLNEEGERLMSRDLHRPFSTLVRFVAERRSCTVPELKQAFPNRASLGNHLGTLTRQLRLIEKQLPVFASESSSVPRYIVADPFLCAWLAVIQSSRQAARVLPVAEVAKRLLPRLRTLEGFSFERMVYAASEEMSRIGCGDFPLTDRIRGYWNRPRAPGRLLEIDFVAWNDDNKRVRFGSCKRNAAGHDVQSLRAFRDQVERFLATKTGRRFRNWQYELALFSPSFSTSQRMALENDDWLCRDIADFRRMLGENSFGGEGALKPSPKISGEE